MKASELIDKLSQVSPDTEVVGGIWNGKVDTYTVLDTALDVPYDSIYADFFGTPDPSTAFWTSSPRMSFTLIPLSTTTWRSSMHVASSGDSPLSSGCTAPSSGKRIASTNCSKNSQSNLVMPGPDLASLSMNLFAL